MDLTKRDTPPIAAADRTGPRSSQDTANGSGMGPASVVPDAVKGWSWGAFLLNWIWAIGNRTWVGLLALVPYVGLIMALVLGFKGREWAWRNKQWNSVEHFNAVQKRWSVWAVWLTVVPAIGGSLAAIALPAYHDYQQRAAQVHMQRQ